MGKLKIGELYLHISKRGIAYKWGAHGDIHRFSFDRFHLNFNRRNDDEYAQSYRQDDDYDDSDYGPYDEKPERFAFLFEYDWLVWVLLIVLPPLGIWVLWKRNQFDTIAQAAISAVSAIWFIVALVWIFSGIFSSILANDSTKLPDPTVPIVVASPTPGTTDGLAADPSADPNTGTSPTGNDTTDSPTPTPIAGTSTPLPDASDTVANDAFDADTYVYTSNSGSYYHKAEICNGVTYSVNASLKFAKENGLTACPTCYGSAASGATDTQTYYGTPSGSYYHLAPTCVNMKDGQPMTKEQAVKDGKGACPECLGVYYMTDVGQYYHRTANCSGMQGAYTVSKKEAVEKGKAACPVSGCTGGTTSSNTQSTSGAYYSTKSGKYYHSDQNCSGMKGASAITRTIALQRNQSPCPKCVGEDAASASTTYYATTAGSYYHVKSNCSGMKGAKAVSLTAAKKAGKKACPVCIESTGQTSSSSSSSSGSYYATKSGRYYHTKSNCSGMKGADKVSLSTALKYNKKACPVCVSKSSSSSSSSSSSNSSSAGNVYATKGGKYYHSKSNCSGMRGASSISLATAKKAGKKACPVCTTAGKSSVTPSPTKPSNVSISSSDKKTYCYATKSGTYYHKTSGCSGMSGASRITIATAKEYGKKICPICASSSSKTEAEKDSDKIYYGTSGNKYYHTKKTCSGMVGASKISLATAKSKKLSACPVCVTKTSATAKKTVTSYCYISSGNKYYHIKKSCSDMKSPQKVTLSAAKSKSLKACPACAGKSLDTTVYVSSSGKLYHSKSTCGGVEMDIKASVAAAVNKGYTPCSKCSAPKSTKSPTPTPKPTATPNVTPAPTKTPKPTKTPQPEVTPEPINQ